MSLFQDASTIDNKLRPPSPPGSNGGGGSDGSLLVDVGENQNGFLSPSSRQHTRPPSTTPVDDGLTVPNAGVRRASTAPLVWNDDDISHKPGPPPKRPSVSDGANIRRKHTEQSSAASGESANPADFGSHAPVAVEGISLLRRPLAVETVWSCEVDTPVPPDFAVSLELSNGLTIVVQHTWRTVDGEWFLVAKDMAGRRVLLARFNRHRTLSWRHLALRTLGSTFAGDVSSLLVLLLAVCLAFGNDGPHSADSGGVGDSGEAISRRGLFFLSRQIDGSNRPIQDACLQLTAALLGVPSAEVDGTLVLRYALVVALSLALFTRLVAKLHERFPPRSTYTLSIAPRAEGVGDDGGDEGARGGGASGWLRRVTSAGEMVGRSRLLGGGKRPEPTEKGGSIVLGMIARFHAAIVPSPAEGPRVAMNGGGGGGGGGLSAPSSGVGGGGGILHSSGSGGGSSGSNGSGGGGGSIASSCHPSPGGSQMASANGSCTASPAMTGGHDHSMPQRLDLLVGRLLDAMMGSLQDGSSVFGPLMILAVKNDEGNLRKARKALDKHAEATGEPKDGITLRELLEAEKASGIHKPGAVLMDPSAAIALLWMRRTLQFLTRCMQGVLTERPMGEVGVEAYQLELEPFHNWLLKSTFAMALNGFPHREEIVNRLGAHLEPPEQRESLLKLEVEQCIEMLHQVVHSMRSLFEELGLEDMRKV